MFLKEIPDLEDLIDSKSVGSILLLQEIDNNNTTNRLIFLIKKGVEIHP